MLLRLSCLPVNMPGSSARGGGFCLALPLVYVSRVGADSVKALRGPRDLLRRSSPCRIFYRPRPLRFEILPFGVKPLPALPVANQGE